MSFFRSFFGACRGTEVFRELRKQSLGKTLRHLFVLSLLCAVFIGIGNYYTLKYRWRSAEAGFKEIFGNKVFFCEKGIVPELEPERSRRQEYPYNGLLIYVSPQGAEKEYPDETLFERNFIILWHPSCLAFLLRRGEKWHWVKYDPETGFPLESTFELSYQDMKKMLLETVNSTHQAKWRLPDDYEDGMTAKPFLKMARLIFAVVKAVIFFVYQFLLVLFCAGVFTLFSRIFSRNLQKDLSAIVMWKVAVYAAMPVIAVVSFFPAFHLPGAGMYWTFFVIGWLAYLFHIIRYLILFPDEDDEKQENVSDGQ